MPRKPKPPIEDPSAEALKLRNQLEVKAGQPEMDDKELAEREGAAQAYATEDEPHFVQYIDDMVKLSTDSMLDIRYQQQECWDVFLEKEPPNFSLKESWQSRVVLPKPYSYVMFFLAIVRKAFDPKFLSIENSQNEDDAKFVQDLMSLQLSRTHSNFPINFTDATGMSAAVGQSMEMIPIWRPGKGLDWDLIEPWKIHRDPDSLSRRPQSGLYWIHEEWLDYHDLKQQEKSGRLVNVPIMGPGGEWGNPKFNPDVDPSELKRRRDMFHVQSAFRTKVLTREFWGTILDSRGELLMPNATFTVVGDRVVRLPKTSPYPTLRWPGTGFTPLPHLLRFDGRSLIQGIKSLWYAMCNLLALHIDNLNWIVNPTKEIDLSSMADQDDIDDYPGKNYLTRGTVQGQQVVRIHDRNSQTGDVLANLNYGDQVFQAGGMVSKELQGLPGWRAEVTAREAAQNLEQSGSIVGLMGENLEDGALSAIQAAYETVRINITYKELATWMGADIAEKYADSGSPTGLRLPELSSGSFKVSGVSTLITNQEKMQGITQMILPLMDKGKFGDLFGIYMKPYQIIQAIVRSTNLMDDNIMVPADKAKELDDAQQKQQEAAAAAAQEKGAADVAVQHATVEHKLGAAHKARGEGDANLAQAGLFESQAAAVGEGE